MGGERENAGQRSLHLSNCSPPSTLPRENNTLKKKKKPEIRNLILNSAFLAHSRKSKRLPVAGSLSSE